MKDASRPRTIGVVARYGGKGFVVADTGSLAEAASPRFGSAQPFLPGSRSRRSFTRAC